MMKKNELIRKWKSSCILDCESDVEFKHLENKILGDFQTSQSSPSLWNVYHVISYVYNRLIWTKSFQILMEDVDVKNKKPIVSNIMKRLFEVDLLTPFSVDMRDYSQSTGEPSSL
jgi:hypothetical protein